VLQKLQKGFIHSFIFVICILNLSNRLFPYTLAYNCFKALKQSLLFTVDNLLNLNPTEGSTGDDRPEYLANRQHSDKAELTAAANDFILAPLLDVRVSSQQLVFPSQKRHCLPSQTASGGCHGP
jgi:hypothetical protein